MKRLVMAFVAMAAIFTACQKDDFKTNGTSEFGVRFEALNLDFALPVQGLAKSASIVSDSLSWDSAHLVVSSIKFEAELKSLLTGKDSIEIEYKWYGPERVDLLNNELTLGNFTLSPGMYDEIELKVSGEASDAGDLPVFYLEGTYKNDAGSWPIVVNVSDDVYFKTEKENVEVTDESVDITSIIQVYLDELMVNVDPTDLDNADQTDGVIIISASSNTDLYDVVLSNLAHDRRTHYKHKHDGDDHEHDGHGDDDDKGHKGDDD